MTTQVFINVRECCRLLSIGRTQFYKLQRQGEFVTAKIGSRRLVLLESAQDFATRCLNAPDAAGKYRPGIRSHGSCITDDLCNTHSGSDSFLSGGQKQSTSEAEDQFPASNRAAFHTPSGGSGNG